MMHFETATADARDVVLSLREDLFNQRYLIDKYDSFIQDPNRVCITAKEGSEVVAFQVLQFYEDGKTVLKHSALVKESLEKRGYFKQLDKHCDIIIRGKGYKHVLLCVSSNKPILSSWSLAKLYNIKTEMNMFTYKLSSNAKHIDRPMKEMEAVTPEMMKIYMTTDHWKSYLFSNEMCKAINTPFELSDDALDLLKSENITFYSNLKYVDGQPSGLLSTSSYHGNLYMDIYGDHVESFDLHIRFHLESNGKVMKGDSMILIVTQLKADRRAIEEILNSCGYVEVKGFHKYCYILDKHF